MCWKLELQANTGWFTEALPVHEHEGLQQSQYLDRSMLAGPVPSLGVASQRSTSEGAYLVDLPSAAYAARGRAAAKAVRRMGEERILCGV